MRPAPDQPRYNVGTALLAWVGAFTVGVFGGTIVLTLTGHAGTEQNALPLWVLALSYVPLSLGLVGATAVVSHIFGTGRVRDDYGLRVRFVDLWGVPAGVVVQLVFVRILYIGLRGLGLDTSNVDQRAKDLTDRAHNGFGVTMLVLFVVVAAPIAEELFFRGLVLRSIAARYSDAVAVVGSAILFAFIHFQPLQFPGLALFGLVAGYCAHRTRRLGMSMFAHAAFNATAVVVLLRR